jgi:hypothetical protein
MFAALRKIPDVLRDTRRLTLAPGAPADVIQKRALQNFPAATKIYERRDSMQTLVIRRISATQLRNAKSLFGALLRISLTEYNIRIAI